MNNQEYIIINKTAIQKRIEELEEISPLDRLCYDGMIECEERVLKQILSQSTPLIPEIEKVFDAGWAACIHRVIQERDDYMTSQYYISNLKLDI